MSEIAETATTTESAEPAQSTAEIAADVIEAGDQPEVTETQTEAPAETQAAAPALSEAEQLLLEEGYLGEKLADGRSNKIPYPRVKAMIDKSREKVVSEWTSKYSAVEAEAKELRGYVEQLRAGVSGDPKAFLAELAQHDPRYRAFLEQTADAARPEFGADMPRPDYELPDGTRTYSLDGIQKQLIPWLAQAIKAETLKEMDSKLTARERAERDKQTASQNSRAERDRQMAEAQTWPMFGTLTPGQEMTPFQSEVLAELRKDSEQAEREKRVPRMTLRQAYLEVYARHQEPNKVRERVLKEMQTAPKRPALGPQHTETAKPATQSTADIARSILSADR